MTTSLDRMRSLISELYAGAQDEQLDAEEFTRFAMETAHELAEIVGCLQVESWTLKERNDARNAALEAFSRHTVHLASKEPQARPPIDLWSRVAAAVLDAVDHRLLASSCSRR